MTAIGDLTDAERPATQPAPADAERSAALRSWLAFGAFALYGTLRWATMLSGAARGRVFLALAVTLLLAALLGWLMDGPQRWTSTSRLWAVGVGIVVLIAAVALVDIAGFPLHLLMEGHFARFAAAWSDGISGLPGLLVPYVGADPLVASALVLGGAALLFAASLMLGTASRSLGPARLGLAATPLLVLAVVPSAIVTPRHVALHGLVTFVLMALLIFAPRLAPGRLGAGVALVAVAAAIGALGAGVLGGNLRWVHAGAGPGPGLETGAEQFNWQQTYGAQGWPYTGATVLRVSAPTATLWKAEDLDDFNGTAWIRTSQPVGDDGDLDGVSASTVRRWTETLGVKVGDLSSPNVITAGYANAPDVAGTEPGVDPGTWVTNQPLQPGESYSVSVYVPHPSDHQLATAGTDYPQAIEPFRALKHLASGSYAGVQALARRLGAGAQNPYGYVEAVLDYLQRGYVYTLNPPSGGAYPLADFLLSSRRGYCQQFAGAMALLLRMKGVPARVAVGFSSGARLKNSDTYLVGDQDAHAWVEVWFPHYGWVTFNPTPGQAGAGNPAAGASPIPPALAATGHAAPRQSTTRGAGATTTAQILTQTVNHDASGAGIGAATHANASGDGPLLIVIALAIVTMLALALIAGSGLAYVRPPSTIALSAELERAFARCGRPLGADVTLTRLATSLSDSPDAAAYISALAAARYGSQGAWPAPGGRAALRRRLARGRGPVGRLRALWALPPRRLSARP